MKKENKAANGSQAKVNSKTTDNAQNASQNVEEIKIPQFISLESTLGAIVLLASRSQSHKFLFMSDLEWLVMPAIAQKQFMLFRNPKNEPVAFVSWAKVSVDVEKRLLSGQTKLQPQDWNSGDKLYVMDVVSPFAQGKEVLNQLQQNQLKGQDVNILRPSKDKKGLESVSLAKFLEDQAANQQTAKVN